MHIFFSEIPDEGLYREGEFPPSIFDLAPDDPIRATERVHYKATIYLTEEAILLHGQLHGRFQLQCGTCLEYFDYEADFPDWSTDLDRLPEEDSFDLRELIREEFLLLLPAHVYCEDFLPDRICPGAALMEQLADESDLPEPPQENGGTWGALENLN